MNNCKKIICHYVHNLENFSGAAFQGSLLASNINSLGRFHCFLINKNSGNVFKSEFHEGFEILHVPNNSFLRFFCLVYIFIIKKIDLVHIHGYEDVLYLVSLLFCKKIFLKSTIIGEDFESLSRKRSRLFLWVFSKVSYNNALSTPIYKINKKYTDNISIIPNFIDEVELVKIDEKENLFLIIGAVCERKRTYESIKYFIENISTQLPGSVLFIVGPHSEGYGEYDDKYVSLCWSLLEGRSDIKVLGQVNKSEVLALMRKAKALLFFSSREGFGSVLIESLSMSCVPIVLKDNEVAYDIIENGVNGFFIDSFSRSISVEEIESLISSGILYETAKFYHIDRIISVYESLYEKIL